MSFVVKTKADQIQISVFYKRSKYITDTEIQTRVANIFKQVLSRMFPQLIIDRETEINMVNEGEEEKGFIGFMAIVNGMVR